MLIEKTILSSVTINIVANTIDVKWENIIFKNNMEIAKTNHRKAYSSSEKELFLMEVENAARYINLVNW